MIVTIEWMEEWFRRFDQEYFGGKLPVPELGLTHAKTRLGQLAYKRLLPNGYCSRFQEPR